MDIENPNHTQETKNKEAKSQSIKVDNSDLVIQDPNENFLTLKSNLFFFKDKKDVEQMQINIEEADLKFLNINKEMDKEEVRDSGIDLCFLVDVSESIHPWRIFAKKSMYYALQDLETFIYSIPDVSADDFEKFRISIVTYTNHDDKEPVKVTDFTEYKNIGDICDKINEINIEKFSSKKRAVFHGLKKVTELSWNEDSSKIIIHYVADAPYGEKYTSSPKDMPTDFDPYPNGIEDLDDKEIMENINDLKSIYNMIKLGENLEKFKTNFIKKVDCDADKPKVEKI